MVSSTRDRLRHVAVLRNRLFQAYLETQMGDLLVRFGRQILAWGETDNFRLLDNINPVDNSFGGFLIPLDERRIPLDMLVANYYFGDVGPIYEAYVEGFLAIDNHVAFKPGIPLGSAWALPNLGEPSTTQFDSRQGPARTFHDARGGVQLKFNAPVPGIGDATFGLAYYRTYLDTPRVQVLVNQNFPIGITSGPATGYLAWAEQTAPPVEIMGGTTTFAIPSEFSRHLFLSGEPIIRSELAYFRGEPRFSQAALDPFIFGTGGCGGLPIATGKSQCSVSGASCSTSADCGDSGGQCVEVMARQGELVRRGGNTYCTGKRSTGDSWNFVLGIDTNQWFRFLNPRQTFFISTQFFYKHLNGAVKRTPVLLRPGCDPKTDPTCLVAVQSGGPAGAAVQAGVPRAVGRRQRADPGAEPDRSVPADPAHRHLLLQRADQSEPDPLLRLERRLRRHPADHLQPRPVPLHGQLQLPGRLQSEGRERRQPAARPRQRALSVRVRHLTTRIRPRKDGCTPDPAAIGCSTIVGARV